MIGMTSKEGRAMTICPVNFKTIDHTVVRITALLSVTLLVVGVIINSFWLLGAVTADFLIRAAGVCVSPLSMLAIWVASFAKLPKSPTDQGAKLFAARLGASGLLVALGFVLSGWILTGWSIALVVGFFALLEALFGFCAGCFIYALLTRRS